MPGRTDASQEWTDVESFAVLEPAADGFRNYFRAGLRESPEKLLVDRAFMLTLTPPEMTVLLGGMRALDANTGQSQHGVFTQRPGGADQRLLREPFGHEYGVARVCHVGGSIRGTRPPNGHAQVDPEPGADQVFGSNSELRALSEVYACEDSEEKFVRDFAAAWDKVMSLDRFDLE